MCVCVLRCRSCLGAVLFLPLVDYHLSERLESLCSSSSAAAPASDSAAVTSVALTNEPRRLDTGLTGFSVEEAALASLRLLYLLVSHSDEVRRSQQKPVQTESHVIDLWFGIFKITTSGSNNKPGS